MDVVPAFEVGGAELDGGAEEGGGDGVGGYEVVA